MTEWSDGVCPKHGTALDGFVGCFWCFWGKEPRAKDESKVLP